MSRPYTTINWKSSKELEDSFGFKKGYGFIRVRPQEKDANSEWRELASDIKYLIKKSPTAEIRRVIEARIEKLRDFEMLEKYADQDEAAFALCDLAFIQNSILHCDPERNAADNTIPEKLATPLKLLADIVGIPPLMSYPLYVLYNARKAPDEGGVLRIEEDAANTFTISHPTEVLTKRLSEISPEHNDEAHFIRVHLGVERKSIKLFQSMFNILGSSAYSPDRKDLILSELNQIQKSIFGMKSDLLLMYFGTGIEAFDHGFRPYLKGTNCFEKDGQKGVIAADSGILVSSHDGGSGAQTPLFILLDAFLGNEASEEVKKFRETQMEFILPGAKRMIEAVTRDSTEVRDFIKADPELRKSFANIAERLEKYREAHMRMVVRYIGGQQGTGGSAPGVLPSLRDETQKLARDLKKEMTTSTSSL